MLCARQQERIAFGSSLCFFNIFSSVMAGHIGSEGFASLCFGFISTSGILGFSVFLALAILTSELKGILNKSL